MAHRSESVRPFLDAFYADLLARGIQYFLPAVRLQPVGASTETGLGVRYETGTDGGIFVDWLGVRYFVAPKGLTLHEIRLLTSVGRVLSARYRSLFNLELDPEALDLFRGVTQDRYVSAFLNPDLYMNLESADLLHDRVAGAIEVLRTSALTTYENRRIATGALVFGSQPDPCHPPPPAHDGALAYSTSLTTIRSFHRLCDGLRTLALLNSAGLLVELVDVREWTRPYASFDLPVPVAARYEPHCRATLCGGHICLVLTPNGEIKIFSEGAQVFNFINGRWHLTDAQEKYRIWEQAVGNREFAERLYSSAINLAEERRGSLFVVLDDASAAPELLAAGDLLENVAAAQGPLAGPGKEQLHYLLRGKSLPALPATVLESIARIDGGIVLDREGNLLAFGAILRLSAIAETRQGVAEGGRTTAAIGASRFGCALKVSEDGLVEFYRNGKCVWEM